MTKEEIKDALYDAMSENLDYDASGGGVVGITRATEKCIEIVEISNREYATGFFKWYAVKMIGFIEYLRDIKPTVVSDEIEEKLTAFEGKTFDELFNLYLEHLKQKGE